MLLSRNFCQRRVRVNFQNFHTVYKVSVEKRGIHSPQKFTLTEKIFRQINYLVVSLVKTLFSRDICRKSVSVQCLTSSRANFA